MGKVSDYFKEKMPKGPANGSASALSTEELEAELEKRRFNHVFPFEVFHPAAKDFMKTMHQFMDIPRPFIGLAMLSAYSTAIGTAYAIERSFGRMFLVTWACMEGIPSSGKTLAQTIIYYPLRELADKYHEEWQRLSNRASDKESSIDMLRERMPIITFRDVHIATLTRSVMPDNPKGVVKEADELLEWINGMNQLSNREGTDEQFWLSSWNGMPFNSVRAGKQWNYLPRVFANIIGGIQPSITWKLFRNDRGTTGFIFRLLFAVPEVIRVCQPQSGFRMDERYLTTHKAAIQKLYLGLPVNSSDQEPRMISVADGAARLHEDWKRVKVKEINRLRDPQEIEIRSGILGKIEDYAYRFCGLLAVSDLAYDNKPFPDRLTVDTEMMARALKLADYFFESAWEVYSRVNKGMYVPMEVMNWVNAYNKCGNMTKLGEIMLSDKIRPKNNSTNEIQRVQEARRKAASRRIQKLMKDYPKVFGTIEKV
jgi:hypothetical protein